jgi:hypothetical protein
LSDVRELTVAAQRILLLVGVAAGLLPIGFAFAYSFVHARWILEPTAREFTWMVAPALAVFGVGYVLYRPTTLGGFGLLACMAVFMGATTGPLALHFANCFHDESSGTTVDVKSVRYNGPSVEFRITSGPEAGRQFEVSKGNWPNTPQIRMELHRGRLGLLWGRLV